MNSGKNIGKKIKQARVINDITQKELADLINVDKQVIYRLENGLKAITADEIKRISAVTKQPESFFYGEEPRINIATNHSAPIIDLTSLKDSQKKFMLELYEEFNKENKTDK